MGYIRLRRLNQAKTKKRETAKKIEENRRKTKKIEKKRKKSEDTKFCPNHPTTQLPNNPTIQS